jgi:hypothetical protein
MKDEHSTQGRKDAKAQGKRFQFFASPRLCVIALKNDL